MTAMSLARPSIDCSRPLPGDCPAGRRAGPRDKAAAPGVPVRWGPNRALGGPSRSLPKVTPASPGLCPSGLASCFVQPRARSRRRGSQRPRPDLFVVARAGQRHGRHPTTTLPSNHDARGSQKHTQNCWNLPNHARVFIQCKGNIFRCPMLVAGRIVVSRPPRPLAIAVVAPSVVVPCTSSADTYPTL